MVKIRAFGMHSERRIRRLGMYLLSAAFVLCLSGCAAVYRPQPKPVTVPQIIAMVKKGISADDIIAKMKASRTVYRLKASQLAKLKEEGIPDKVLNYMQWTYLDAVRRDTRYQDWRYWTMDDDFWYGGPPYGWPYYP